LLQINLLGNLGFPFVARIGVSENNLEGGGDDRQHVAQTTQPERNCG
jgi:hypothetical protein